VAATAERVRLLWRRASDQRWMTHDTLDGLDYRRALAIHRVLDDARVAGRLPLVNALVVRSVDDDDVRWRTALRSGTLGYLFVGRQRGYSDLVSAVRAKTKGVFVGEVGGWIYRVRPLPGQHPASAGRPICQGWAALDARKGYSRTGEIVLASDPRTDSPIRYYVNDLHMIDPEVVFGPQHEPTAAAR
jgi:hypothetical protein